MFTSGKYVRFIILILIIIANQSIFSQPGKGLPIWVISPVSDSGIIVIDWRVSPPAIKSLANIIPSYRSTSISAVNKCGDAVFHVIHSGISNVPNNLFIYDPQGKPLLDNTTGDGPGLNAKLLGEEYQVLGVPGAFNEWYIIYQQFKPNLGAPYGNGVYEPANILYSRVLFSCGSIRVFQRDVPLTVSGVAYNYTNGEAISHLPDNQNHLCFYGVRRDLSDDYISIDRFLITADGILFDKNTGNVYADNWYLSINGGTIDVSPDGHRIAFNNRDQSTDGQEIIIFDAAAFNNSPANYQNISINDLILQPDGIVLTYSASVEMVANNNGSLLFLRNMSSKIYDLEFSPDGEYLYYTSGGFVAGGYTNATYLGQIEIGPLVSPNSYPYNLRLQIQKPPGSFNSYDGSGGLESNYPDNYHQVIVLEKAFNGAIYFIKRNTPTLFSIPFPDQPMPQCLVPSEINLADATCPNLNMHGKLWMIPDQIDGINYVSSVNPSINLGNDTSVCAGPILLTPGPGFMSYCWQDGATSEIYLVSGPGTYWVEVIDEFGCLDYDTINIVYNGLDIELGDDVLMCEGDSVFLSPGAGFIDYLWSDNSTQAQLNVKNGGLYWVEVTQGVGCFDRDSVFVTVNPRPAINLGPDSTICDYEVITLNAGQGFSQYSWNDGSDNQYFSVHDSGLYWVEVFNTAGCSNRDSVNINLFPSPNVELGDDTLIVYDETFLLDAGPEFISYNWKDGSHGQYCQISENGLYWVEVGNEQCFDTDTVYVILNDCTASMIIPNCFTPNGDGFNDNFNITAQNLEAFTMYIFNRWGQQIFETQDINRGWDGKFKGNKCEVGTYFYLIRYTTPCSFGIEKSGERKGSVTLLE